MAGQREVEYFRTLPGLGAIHARMRREGPTVLAFTVQFEIWIEDVWRPAVRYDSAHGRAHRDTLDWDGRVIDKFWLSPNLTLNEAMIEGERDLIDNAASYHADFLRRRP